MSSVALTIAGIQLVLLCMSFMVLMNSTDRTQDVAIWCEFIALLFSATLVVQMVWNPSFFFITR